MEWSVLNYLGEPSAPQQLSDVRATYSVALLEPQAPRAEFVLAKHVRNAANVEAASADAWHHALQDGWIRQGVPFVIERREMAWCFRDKTCPSQDAKQDGFLKTLGSTVLLLAPLPGIVASLEGKTSDGQLSFELPGLLVQRLGLAEDTKITATEVAAGIPSTFEAVARAERTAMAKVKENGVEREQPQTTELAVTARIVIDEGCRVLDVSVTSDTSVSLVPGTKSASRFVQRRHWQVQPAN